MILYHGTLLANAKQIFNDNILSVTTDKNTHYKDNTGIYRTKRGYVYLTDSIKCAFEFGAKHILNDNYLKAKQGHEKAIPVICILKFDINPEELELDDDENIIQGCDYCEGASFYRLKRNIIIKEELIEYTCYKFKEYNSVYRFLENDDNLDKITWKKI